MEHEPAPAGQARLVAVSLGLSVGLLLPGFLTGSLAVEIREDFPFDASTLGLSLALFYLTSAVTSAPAGRLVERLGAARGMDVAAALGVLSAVGIAVLGRSTTSLVVLLGISGMAKAVGSPAVASLLAGEVAPERRGLAFGLQQSAPPVCALLAGLALPLVAIPLDWRWAFAAAAAMTMACRVVAPRHVARGSPCRPAAAQPRGRGVRSVHVVAAATALASAAAVGMVAFLVVFAVELGMSPGEAGALLVVSSVVAIASRIGLGALADRRRGDLLGQSAALLAFCGAGFVLLATGSVALVVAGALIAGGIGRGWHGLANLAVVEQNPRAAAEAVGIQMSGFWIGAMVGPLLVGTLADGAGFEVAWLACAGLMLLAAVTALVARRIARHAALQRA